MGGDSFLRPFTFIQCHSRLQRPTSIKVICAFLRFEVILKWSSCEISLFESVWKYYINAPYFPIKSSKTCFALSLFASVALL